VTAAGGTATASPAGGVATSGDINLSGGPGDIGAGAVVTAKGGDSQFGKGAGKKVASLAGVTGAAGLNYGGGGGGAAATGVGAGADGGAGAGGLILIEEYGP